MDSDQLRSLRHEYAARGLAESDLAGDPVTMFGRWFDEAAEALGEPNAMVVSTVGADGAPSSRMVLLKGYDERGFVFYTNTSSRKGRDLGGEGRCALLFPWHDLERQVRVEGVAQPLSREEVDAYFAVRPRESRLGAHASHQSAVVDGRGELEAAYEAAEERFEGVDDVPAPEEWGGYRVEPEVVEFWQGRRGRMHDRLVYRGTAEGWDVVRLAP
ncbi:pyridoxamine 5'-phosphate oxidase [Nocardioides acrostichi]|uniref:Pyridoxine/pyridoxamine 5'-phosphate oxidase n=1 Tax=Nocardioides acrostichi TaxID=2784339 RepID=A0A930Y7V1_9ACTN|nr:pyridoxamine 5'-phosphate oxidase [Nocardioides acrostichi]MBF4162427.1 pyridoxamine 5'-phosphate oxidase [Nocardioides acrostichi]